MLFLLFMAVSLCILSKRHPDNLIIKQIRRWGWLISTVILVGIIVIQIQHPLGVVGDIILLAMVISTVSIIRTTLKRQK